jgi:hypothetical protein
MTDLFVMRTGAVKLAGMADFTFFTAIGMDKSLTDTALFFEVAVRNYTMKKYDAPRKQNNTGFYGNSFSHVYLKVQNY